MNSSTSMTMYACVWDAQALLTVAWRLTDVKNDQCISQEAQTNRLAPTQNDFFFHP